MTPLVSTEIASSSIIGPIIMTSDKVYHLSIQQKEKYKVCHPQVAPEVRDGICKQSFASDVQWNLSKAVTFGPENFGLCIEVAA